MIRQASDTFFLLSRSRYTSIRNVFSSIPLNASGISANRSRRNMIARSRHLHGTAVSIPSFSVRIHSLPLQTGHTSEPFETSGTSAFFKQFVERFFTRSSIPLIMFFICWSIIHSFQVLHKQVFFQKVLRVLDVPG